MKSRPKGDPWCPNRDWTYTARYTWAVARIPDGATTVYGVVLCRTATFDPRRPLRSAIVVMIGIRAHSPAACRAARGYARRIVARRYDATNARNRELPAGVSSYDCRCGMNDERRTLAEFRRDGLNLRLLYDGTAVRVPFFTSIEAVDLDVVRAFYDRAEAAENRPARDVAGAVSVRVAVPPIK